MAVDILITVCLDSNVNDGAADFLLELATAIDSAFSSFDTFKAAFWLEQHNLVLDGPRLLKMEELEVCGTQTQDNTFDA
jgi:superoxide dismutase